LLFDFLEGHVNKDAVTRKRYNHVVANAEALLMAARRAGAMVAHAHADHRADLGTTARRKRASSASLRRNPATSSFPSIAGAPSTGRTWTSRCARGVSTR
jgi:hypothetical protein